MSRKATAGAGSTYPWKRKGVQVGWIGAAGYTGPDGKRRRRVVYAQTRGEAQEKLNEVLVQHQRGELPTGPRLTVETWLLRWLKRGSWRPRTRQHYQWLIETHLVPGLGKRALAKLRPTDVDDFLAAKLKSNLAPRTVHHLRACLRNSLQEAMRDRLLTFNAAGLAHAVKVPRY